MNKYILIYLLFLSPFLLGQKSYKTKEVSLLKKQKKFLTTFPKESITIGEKLVKNTNNDSIKGISLLNLSSAYLLIGNYEKALSYNKSSIPYIDKNSDSFNRIFARINLSDLYKNLGLFDLSEKMNKQCFEIFEKAPPSDNSFYTLAMIYFDIANLNIYANQYDKSTEMFKKSLFYLEKSKNIKEKKYSDRFKAFILTLLANIYTDKEQYKQAKKYIDEASILEKKDPNPIARINIYRDVSIIYLANNQPQLAIDTLSNIINSDNIPLESRAAFYDILAHSYKKLHNKDKEILYMNKLDSITSLKSANEKKTSNMISKIANEELQNEKEYLFKIRILYAITILSFSMLLVFLYRKYKKKIKEQKRLYEKLTEKIRNNKPSTAETKISLTDSKEQEIINLLDNFEEKKMYLNKDISLPNLAAKFKTNTVYLSDVINKHKKKNFNSYINELRINYITKEIYNNPKFSQYKISYLADLCGFSSHSIFASIFKKTTGISPSVYIQMCRNNQLTEKSNILSQNSQ